ncbi:hypothetical protein Emed_002079 [Eimeria media]
MGLPRLFLFAAASQILVDLSAASNEEMVKVVRLADAGTCLTDLNAARQDAGLPALTTELTTEDEEKDFFNKEEPADELWKPVCETLLDGSPFTPSQEVVDDLIPALFRLGDGDTTTPPQCSAAVKQWQKGYTTFKANPPVDRKVEYSEMTPEGLSFVTLYNPSDGAKGQCVVAACTEKPKGDNDSDSMINAQSNSKVVAGLVCVTAPVPFDRDRLFT